MEKSKADMSLRAKQLEALAMTRYKVSVITMGKYDFTIMAVDEKSAVDQVMKGKGGRDAGTEGPVPFAYRIQDMSIIQPPVTLQQVMAEIGKGDMGANPAPLKPPLITLGG